MKDELRILAISHPTKFEDGGFDMCNLHLSPNSDLHFNNEQGMVLQLVNPYKPYAPILILTYHDNDNDIISWDDLQDTDKDIIFDMVCKELEVDYNLKALSILKLRERIGDGGIIFNDGFTPIRYYDVNFGCSITPLELHSNKMVCAVKGKVMEVPYAKLSPTHLALRVNEFDWYITYKRLFA